MLFVLKVVSSFLLFLLLLLNQLLFCVFLVVVVGSGDRGVHDLYEAENE